MIYNQRVSADPARPMNSAAIAAAAAISNSKDNDFQYPNHDRATSMYVQELRRKSMNKSSKLSLRRSSPRLASSDFAQSPRFRERHATSHNSDGHTTNYYDNMHERRAFSMPTNTENPIAYSRNRKSNSQLKMIKKYIPGPNGLTIIEVPDLRENENNSHIYRKTSMRPSNDKRLKRRYSTESHTNSNYEQRHHSRSSRTSSSSHSANQRNSRNNRPAYSLIDTSIEEENDFLHDHSLQHRANNSILKTSNNNTRLESLKLSRIPRNRSYHYGEQLHQNRHLPVFDSFSDGTSVEIRPLNISPSNSHSKQRQIRNNQQKEKLNHNSVARKTSIGDSKHLNVTLKPNSSKNTLHNVRNNDEGQSRATEGNHTDNPRRNEQGLIYSNDASMLSESTGNNTNKVSNNALPTHIQEILQEPLICPENELKENSSQTSVYSNPSTEYDTQARSAQVMDNRIGVSDVNRENPSNEGSDFIRGSAKELTEHEKQIKDRLTEMINLDDSNFSTKDIQQNTESSSPLTSTHTSKVSLVESLDIPDENSTKYPRKVGRMPTILSVNSANIPGSYANNIESDLSILDAKDVNSNNSDVDGDDDDEEDDEEVFHDSYETQSYFDRKNELPASRQDAHRSMAQYLRPTGYSSSAANSAQKLEPNIIVGTNIAKTHLTNAVCDNNTTSTAVGKNIANSISSVSTKVSSPLYKVPSPLRPRSQASTIPPTSSTSSVYSEIVPSPQPLALKLPSSSTIASKRILADDTRTVEAIPPKSEKRRTHQQQRHRPNGNHQVPTATKSPTVETKILHQVSPPFITVTSPPRTSIQQTNSRTMHSLNSSRISEHTLARDLSQPSETSSSLLSREQMILHNSALYPKEPPMKRSSFEKNRKHNSSIEHIGFKKLSLRDSSDDISTQYRAQYNKQQELERKNKMQSRFQDSDDDVSNELKGRPSHEESHQISSFFKMINLDHCHNNSDNNNNQENEENGTSSHEIDTGESPRRFSNKWNKLTSKLNTTQNDNPMEFSSNVYDSTGHIYRLDSGEEHGLKKKKHLHLGKKFKKLFHKL
ncbi:Seg2p NDAI_0K02660 [Naumovozyma dairenensis CBS 421]|uniref:Uncharacterized protein n=1 Tax=Naumovozyma dairenensis (strain ATCC 10597 / BCRC 20456 / CBS 421 / NBRC 0211 / NRRL Y-12639) TaxID=1071378 RepID=G0WI46_NAUDC|nr:hypothetical protein NDAI_0K02660 [Naumovozyma dairenensis CBS 421]CCD27457.1 hypothetical protein NDAI_0K02660 [Naumovozyma dairenensis CBS 421]